MAGRGRAPKPPEQRVRRHAPERGDWVTLRALRKPVLPALPKRSAREGAWSGRTKAVWAAWREDPATGMYGPAQIADAIELAWLYEDYVRSGGARLATEIRIRMDALGLTLKGKRDLRWRMPADDEPAQDERPKLAPVRRLRAVDSAG